MEDKIMTDMTLDEYFINTAIKQVSDLRAQLAAERGLLDRALGTLRYISAQGEANHPGFNRVAKMNADNIIKNIEAHKATRQPTQDKGE
jgi:hypothetical protein